MNAPSSSKQVTMNSAAPRKSASRVLLWVMPSCALGLLTAAGCTQASIEPGVFVLTQGQEQDAWPQSPKPLSTTVRLEPRLSAAMDIETIEGAVTEVTAPDAEEGHLSVIVRDAEGLVRARARTPWIAPPSFQGSRYPLFLGRSDRFSRPPESLIKGPGASPLLLSAEGRYLLAFVPGDSNTLDFIAYDFLTWTATPTVVTYSCPTSPCTVKTAMSAGPYLLVLGDGWQRWVELSTGDEAAVTLPDGLDSFTSLEDARPIVTPDGRSYLVAATAKGEKRSSVLELDPDGNLTAYTLKTARSEAAAQWVDEVGLVVSGGSDIGPGLEVLPPDATAFLSIPYPADPVQGAGLVGLDGATVLRAGGHDATGMPAPTLVLDPTCSSDCIPTIHSAGPVALNYVSGTLSSSPPLMVGLDPTGSFHGYLLVASQWVEAPLRESRQGGSALLVPTGHLCVAGGLDSEGKSRTSLEMLIP
jgi:hypothetical protein